MQYLNLPGPKAQEIIERDKRIISPTYPRVGPFVIQHGKGTEVWDVDGNRFLDFAAGIAVVATGHCHPQVVKAIREQAENFIHISPDFYHERMVELGEKLDEITPFTGNAVSFLTNSGTESVEAAIKLARYHTGRTQFIGFLGGFHGRSMGSVTFTASKPKYHHGFYPLMNGVVHAPFPDPYRPILQTNPGEDYGEAVVRYIEEQILARLLPAEDVAGVLVETIQGEGGYVIPAPGFLSSLRELCDRYGILMILDEVQSGIGRTGKTWAFQHFGIEPDIICVAKGIASGMPLGAMIAKEEIVTWSKGAHGNTYGGNPVACAAALATIDLVENGYKQNAVRMGDYILDLLEDLQARHPCIGQVRGMGLMIGIEFVRDRVTKEPAGDLRDQIVHRAFERGLIIIGCGDSTIRIAPPLNISQAEVDEALMMLEDSIIVCVQEESALVT